jgi:hypothetical protein
MDRELAGDEGVGRRPWKRVVAHVALFPSDLSLTPGGSPLVNSTPTAWSALRMRASWYAVMSGSPATLSTFPLL